MRVLVTGTTGFVGRNIKEAFATRFPSAWFPKRQELNLLETDSVSKYLRKGNFDVVIHCGVTLHSVEENLKMYFNLERCSECFGKLICVGSGAEYGPQYYVPRMRETYFGKHVPTDIYGFSKYVISKDIVALPRNIFNLRVFGIFGKYENYKRRFISNNICRALSGQAISINKNMVFDYLFVDDFLEILATFISSNPNHRAYNVCRGQGVTLTLLAETIKAVHGQELPIILKSQGENPEYTGDNSLYSEEFGVPTFHSLDESIEQLYKWYKDESGIDFTSKLSLGE
jgi:UDP-glucose 4-epimerase